MENEEYAGAEKQILSITSVSMCRRQGPKTRQQYKEHVRAGRGTVSCGGFGRKVPPPPYDRCICVCKHACTHRSGKHAPCRLWRKCASVHLRMRASHDTETDATTHAQSGLWRHITHLRARALQELPLSASSAAKHAGVKEKQQHNA